MNGPKSHRPKDIQNPFLNLLACIFALCVTTVIGLGSVFLWPLVILLACVASLGFLYKISLGRVLERLIFGPIRRRLLNPILRLLRRTIKPVIDLDVLEAGRKEHTPIPFKDYPLFFKVGLVNMILVVVLAPILFEIPTWGLL